MEIYARTENHAGIALMRGRVETRSPSAIPPDQTILLVTPQQFAAISPPVQPRTSQPRTSQPQTSQAQLGQPPTGDQSMSVGLVRERSAQSDSYAHSASPRETGNRMSVGAYDAGREQAFGAPSRRGKQSLDGTGQRIESETGPGFWGRVAGQLRWVFQ